MNLRDLSNLLGLSQTTVSRALNGYPEVSPATRDRVMRAAEEYGYSPNASARALAMGRSNAIGHVVPVSNREEALSPIFCDFLAGAAEAYSKEGFDLMLTLVADDLLADAYRAQKQKGSVDGVIVHWPQARDPRIELLTEIGLPFLVHGRVAEAAAPYSWVDVDNRRAFFRATEYLVDLGHRRIALVNGRQEFDFAVRRQTGFTEALLSKGITPDPALIRSSEMTEGYGHASAAELLALPDPPTAFLASSILIAWGIRRAAADRGLELGRDVSVFTFDDALYYAGNADPEPVFSAARSSAREAGLRAAEIIIDLIRNPESGPRECLLKTEFILGRSTGPAPRGGGASGAGGPQ